MATDWLEYENAARTVVVRLRGVLGIGQVEGKQRIVGASGATWEFDAIAWSDGANNMLVVEARRHTTSRLKQEHIAALAFRVQDVGASGGIVATPLPMQVGANTVAASANIRHILLAPESTPETYLARYLEQSYRGITFADSLSLGHCIPLGGELK